MRFVRVATSAVFALATSVVTAAGCSSLPSREAFTDDAGSRGVEPPLASDAGRDEDRTFDAGHALSQVTEASGYDAALVRDAGFGVGMPDVGTDSCVANAPGPGPVQHICVIYPAGDDDGNECDGHHDLPGFEPNGTTGNGFDDNCNGLVDEGCACPAVGTTKTCYLVPASQTVDDVPVGWCAENSKGTVNCVQQGESGPVWSGVCRGAEPPYPTDFCAPGDFNCDGKAENSTTKNCSCTTDAVQCPTAPVTTTPYPPPNALPLEVDAASWFSNPGEVAAASGWTWTLTGGDCDNVLPHPTFALYPTSNGQGDPVGKDRGNLGPDAKEQGWVATAPSIGSVVYPAFALSGDYLLSASWELAGQTFSCSVKVQVRAPGVRAEGCWDTAGQRDDLDLHVAKVNGFPECGTEHGWSDLEPDCADQHEDCFYGGCYGEAGDATDWGYADSPPSSCSGWGSQAGNVTSCINPRLDRDTNGISGLCDVGVANPNASSFEGVFCGPENVNVDHPNDDDRFAVALRFFARHGTLEDAPARAHVNVYCDGVRVLSSGYDPTVPGSDFPKLTSPGADSSGDMWKVALIQTTVTAAGLSCSVASTSSAIPDLARDGSSAFCVDDAALEGAPSQALLTASGLEPANANALCFH